LDHWDRLDLEDEMDLKDHLDVLEMVVSMDPRDHLDPVEHLEMTVCQDHQDHPDHQDHLDFQEVTDRELPEECTSHQQEEWRRDQITTRDTDITRLRQRKTKRNRTWMEFSTILNF